MGLRISETFSPSVETGHSFFVINLPFSLVAVVGLMISETFSLSVETGHSFFVINFPN